LLQAGADNGFVNRHLRSQAVFHPFMDWKVLLIVAVKGPGLASQVA
jgi:hypothetical protein